MKTTIKTLSSFIIFSLFVSQWFATEIPTNLKVNSFDRTWVELTWTISSDSIIYLVYYSLTSWAESNYVYESDYIEWTSTKISNLEEWKTYYFSVVWIDENGIESTYSEEVVLDYNTKKQDSNIDFVLEWLDVINDKKIEADFSLDLDNSESAIREFKITNKNDRFDTIDVMAAELKDFDNSIIEIDLESPIKAWVEYEFVVIAVSSSTWKNIESWIDSMETFSLQKKVENDINEEFSIEWWTNSDNVDNTDTSNAVINNENTDTSNTVINNEEEEHIEFNSAWPSEWNSNANIQNKKEEKQWISWGNISAADIENTTLWLAEKNSKLPTTGPEHIFIIILSIILWALILKFKKS